MNNFTQWYVDFWSTDLEPIKFDIEHIGLKRSTHDFLSTVGVPSHFNGELYNFIRNAMFFKQMEHKSARYTNITTTCMATVYVRHDGQVYFKEDCDNDFTYCCHSVEQFFFIATSFEMMTRSVFNEPSSSDYDFQLKTSATSADIMISECRSKIKHIDPTALESTHKNMWLSQLSFYKNWFLLARAQKYYKVCLQR
jgi:hypothetical protein